jgi:LPPG:FO 2-phospho-L-lactate transferase
VGGAKLAFGLTRQLAPEDLTIVVNTGDDFEHLGLSVSPDIDTVLYTLSGLSDRKRGWGLAGETWHFIEAMRRLGGETWFALGDRDLATHVERTRRLAAGETLSQVTANFARALGLVHPIAPMTDGRLRTIVETIDGPLPFQHYFAKAHCEPVARGVRFEIAADAALSPGFRTVLERDDIAAVILCPSNPYLSIDPILALPGARAGLEATGAPIVAVSPIIGGKALKGPAAKLMTELGVTPGVVAVAEHYRGLLSGLVIDRMDRADAAAVRARGVKPLATRAVMRSDEDRTRLARETLDFAAALAPEPSRRRAS